MRTIMRWLVALVALLVLVALLGIGALRGSLAQLDGQASVDGLAELAEITRDAYGVPDIKAANRVDLARALGYIHGQDRFFQMDLLRRDAAGELSALFGAAAVAHDKKRRFHGLRTVARGAIANAEADMRELLDAYTGGVNAGLGSLRVRPFEYLLLRQKPRPWTPEDSALAILAMWLTLTDEDAARDLNLTRMRAVLPQTVFEYLTQAGSPLDAALDGSVWPAIPLPTATEFDVREQSAALAHTAPTAIANDNHLEGLQGSNNWALAGNRSQHGGAIVANDMHLSLRVPNIWYRARLRVPSAGLDMVGVTLPGAPAVVAGSTGHIAWGFTNSYVDTADLIELELATAADGKQRYLSSDGPQTFIERKEVIEVAGGDAVAFTVMESLWGPVRNVDGKAYAVSWIAHNPQAVNAELIRFEQARSVSEAIKLAGKVGIPPQNLAVVDKDGNVGWTLLGAMPAIAHGLDRRAALSWKQAQLFHLPANNDRVTLMRREDRRPRLINPKDGLIFTANSRVVDEQQWPQLADGSYALGARQAQIAEGLRQREKHTEQDMLAIALDDRAVFMTRWYELLRSVVSRDDASADATAIAALLDAWTGRAEPDNVAYRWTREFRASAHDLVIEGLLHPVRERYPDLELIRMRQLEAVVWQLLEERPAHLLSPRFATYEALLSAAVTHAVERVRQSHPGPLGERVFSEFSHKPVAHPLTRAVPALSPYLNMANVSLPGDAFMPRVTRRWGGASERFAVSPGREAQAYFHMPGGQSGHPLSDFYRKGHSDWAQGQPSPLLPGATLHRLTLGPR